MSISVEKEKETKEKIKVFSRNSFTWLKIGKKIYTPFGVSNFSSEEEVEEYFRSISLYEYEIKNFHVTIIPYDTLIEFSCKYFALRLNSRNFFLHLEDKAHPEYTWVRNFGISSEEAFLLLNYVFSRAEKISSEL